ncbi:hypothetical protein G6N76_15560 [Rhizobium daejeonense]|uniref:Uncharacterized protein n=1 Tax=Rhizobium daejeonense TaxID=240521 RepID=A0A6M1S1V6_9HYPH|nr:hypothetical protein [Rhizobium daejeonense]NGO65085.1 hypothetical protein [Rhizobium daejeonense]
MLPPVQAISNSGTSYPDSRKPQEISVDVAARPAAVQQTATQGLEQNTAIAGRLNMLLLSGQEQERTSQNLASLIDLLGRAMKVERNDGESLSGYATRLVQTLASLSPDDRQTVQRQLAQLFGGLQLRTLIEAFRNPAGPEAAMLSIYLELYRNKDRDLAARLAVTSYRQNSGEQKQATGPVPPQPVPAPPQSSKQSVLQAANQPLAPPEESLAEDVVQPVNRDATARPRPDRDVGNEAVRNGLKSTVAAVGTNLIRNTAVAAPQGNTETDTDDIRTLQDRLRHNFDFGDEPETLPASARAIPAQDTARAAIPSREPAQQSAVPRTPDADPDIGATQSGLQDAADGVADQAFNALKSSKDAVIRTLVSNSAELLPQSVEEGDRDGLSTSALPVSAGEADEDRAPFDASRASGMARGEAAQSALHASGADEPDQASASAPNAARTTNPTATPAEVDNDHAALRQNMMLREGVPLPVINYLIAQDDYVEDEKELRHRYEDEDGEQGDDRSEPNDEGGEDHGEAEEETATQESVPAEPSPVAEGNPDGPVPLLAADMADGLPIADLYHRMANWA